MTDESKAQKGSRKQAREARLAAALRENLRRRKEQARARETGDEEASRDSGEKRPPDIRRRP